MIVQYLSEEQENKLIEMSLSLFPQYKSIDFVGTCDLCLEGTMRFSQHYNPAANWNDWILIHWFEFCYTHLASKIYNKKDDYINEEHQEFLLDTIRFNNHPIDYLYEQFKQLKQ